METPLIEFRNVTKRFNGMVVLDHINVSIFENQITTIIGKSGTGKSVLLKHCIGLLHPDEGDILMEGMPVTEMIRSGKWRRYKHSISYMFQDNALFDSMTVFENVALPLRQTTRFRSGEIRDKVMARLEQTELFESAGKYPAELSQGMQKRVALARALVTDPRVVLFDEPTTGQDVVRRNNILSMIAHYKARFGFTAVLISHDIPDVFFISDRILMLWEKQIVFQGTYEEAIALKHPMIIELLQSLEQFQGELVHARYRQMFRCCYASLFGPRPAHSSGVAIACRIDYDPPGAAAGRPAAGEGVRSIGAFIGNYLGDAGGITMGQNTGEMITFIPHISIEEAKQAVNGLAGILQEEALPGAVRAFRAETKTAASPDITVWSGISEMTPEDDLDQIVNYARAVQQPIARTPAGGGDPS